MTNIDNLKLPPGRELPQDIRCMKCSTWIRGGPLAWSKAATEIDPLPRWYSRASIGAGVLALVAAAIAVATSGVVYIVALAVAIGALAAALKFSLGIARSKSQDQGTVLTLVGISLGLTVAPVVFMLIALF